MLGGTYNRTRRNAEARPPPEESLLGGIKRWVQARLKPEVSKEDALITRISEKVEGLSLQLQKAEKDKQACDELIREDVKTGRPTRQHELQRARAVKKIRSLQGRIGAVAKNEDMIRNAETDVEIASLMEEVNGYMEKHKRDDSVLENLEETMQEQDEYVGIQETRDQEFSFAFDRYNEELEVDIGEDEELAELKKRAAEEAELEIAVRLPNVSGSVAAAAEPARAHHSARHEPEKKREGSAKVASWDDGW